MVMMANNLQKSIWVAPASVINGVSQYGTPIEYHLNCRVINSLADRTTYGPKYLDYRRAVASNDDVLAISELDRVWIDKVPNDPSDVFAKDANFYVVSNDPGVGGTSQIMFKKLSADG